MKNFEPNPIQLRDIKFFKKNANIIYLESRWNKKEIGLNDGFILGYSLGLKEQNRDQWKTCLGEFMSLMHDNQEDLSFYVLNFDICKPINFTSFDKIQLMKIENGKMSLHDYQVNAIKEVCENKEPKPTIEEEENKKECINIVLVNFEYYLIIFIFILVNNFLVFNLKAWRNGSWKIDFCKCIR